MAVAKYLVGQSHNVVLTARSAAPMHELQNANKSHVEYLAGDITDPEVSTPVVHLLLSRSAK